MEDVRYVRGSSAMARRGLEAFTYGCCRTGKSYSNRRQVVDRKYVDRV